MKHISESQCDNWEYTNETFLGSEKDRIRIGSLDRIDQVRAEICLKNASKLAVL